MTDYFTYKLLLILGIGSMFFCSKKGNSSARTEKTDKPNIILLMADDQGWGDVGYNGNEHIITPHIDKMAKDGVRFNRFYAAAPVCSPTRGSCLTGRHPFRYGIYHANVGKMKASEITIAEAVKDLGYQTGHFGKWHLGTLTNDEIDANRGGRNPDEYSPPWDNGFDVCFSTESKVPTWDPMITPGKEAGDIGNQVTGESFGTSYWTSSGNKVSENLEGDDARIIMDRVIPFIHSCVVEKKPFLSVVWFHTPHLPVLTGEDYKKMYAGYNEDIQNFYGSITAMDQQVGRLQNELKKLGIADNTIIFYTSDNGPEGTERLGRTQGSTNGLKGRKRSLYEGGIRVPGIMVWPDQIKHGKEINIPVSTIDYFPTIMDVLTKKNSNQPILDGVSLMPMIRGTMNERPSPIGFQHGNQRAFIDNRYKIYSPNDGKTYELYDIENDAAEASDISIELPVLKDTLISKLNRWIISCKKSDNGFDYN